MTAREANEISARIRDGIVLLHATAEATAVRYVETDLFVHQLVQRLKLHPEGREELSRPIATRGRHSTAKSRLSRHLHTKPSELTRLPVAQVPTERLAELTGLDISAARKLRLEALGFDFPDTAHQPGGSTRGAGT